MIYGQTIYFFSFALSPPTRWFFSPFLTPRIWKRGGCALPVRFLSTDRPTIQNNNPRETIADRAPLLWQQKSIVFTLLSFMSVSIVDTTLISTVSECRPHCALIVSALLKWSTGASLLLRVTWILHSYNVVFVIIITII